jgi:acyl-CoA synthetase (AMP-forming)/AMP-acid ligase II
MNDLHHIHELLDASAARLPTKTAVLTEEGSITYGQLAEDSRRLATWMRESGVCRGDRVVVLLPNGIPVLVAALAASRLGAIFCIVNYATKAYNLQHILQDCGPTLVFTNRERWAQEDFATVRSHLLLEEGYPRALEAPPIAERSPAITLDPCFLIYTSGSTSKPKAVVAGHRNVLFAAWAIQQRLRYRESDIVGNFLPLGFDFGLYQAFLSWQVGATLALGREDHVGPPLVKKMRDWGITGMPIVPSLANVLIRMASRSNEPLPALRFLTNSGAHLPSSYIADLKRQFAQCEVFVMFGLTECKRVAILLPEEYEHKSASVGRPLTQTECIIIGSDGEEVPRGEHGELVVRGPNVMLGYWNAPEQTAKRYRVLGPRFEVALFTGDVCSMDKDGYLYFHGRNDDIYKQRGHRVSTIEVEGAACCIAGVVQAAVIPHRDDSGATLVLVGEASTEMALRGLRERLEDFKVPTRVVKYGQALPVTPNQKVDKKALVRLLEEGILA